MAACVTQDRHSGGYDCQFVDIPRDADVICKICQIPSREPQISVCCGHTFCKSCLDTANSVVGSTIVAKVFEQAVGPGVLQTFSTCAVKH